MDFDCELRMLLHQSHAGCLIGKGGSRIKELREKTGSQIKIFSSCCPNSTERIVQINGVPNVVVNCVKEVCSLISQAPIKGPNKQYDPHHFNPMFANEYGGYEENMQKGRGGRGGFRGRPNRGRGGRGGGRVWSEDSDFGFGPDGGQGGGYGGSPFGRGQGLMRQVPGGMGNRWNQSGGPGGVGGERQWAEDTDSGFGVRENQGGRRF